METMGAADLEEDPKAKLEDHLQNTHFDSKGGINGNNQKTEQDIREHDSMEELEEEFDDFNVAQAEEEKQDENEEVDDDEFGSFDDASVEKKQEEGLPKSIALFNEDIFEDDARLQNSIYTLVDSLFTSAGDISKPKSDEQELLTERREEFYARLHRMRYFRPKNWKKLPVRHRLLIALGLPVDLDELNGRNTNILSGSKGKSSEEKATVVEEPVPEFSTLGKLKEETEKLISSTNALLSDIEIENMTHCSRQFLNEASEEAVNMKLQQYRHNHTKLLELMSVWIHRLECLRDDIETYEMVVQSMIGYSQRLKRDEIQARINKLKLKSKTKITK